MVIILKGKNPPQTFSGGFFDGLNQGPCMLNRVRFKANGRI